MHNFISYKEDLTELLSQIVKSDVLHSRWLNTLSYLENTGARKIAACQHPTQVKEEMLKHAAEEFRHAHYLKRQIGRVLDGACEDYSKESVLGGVNSLHYLNSLDLQVSRYLSLHFTKADTKAYAYLLVTYAIEMRASELYPIYEAILRGHTSKVTVKSILLEEKEHLQEMQDAIKSMPQGSLHANEACRIESELCSKWLRSINSWILM